FGFPGFDHRSDVHPDSRRGVDGPDLLQQPQGLRRASGRSVRWRDHEGWEPLPATALTPSKPWAFCQAACRRRVHFTPLNSKEVVMAGFASKNILVLGGSRGVGAAIVRRFAGEGANVVFTYAGSEAAALALAKETAAQALKVDSAEREALTRAVADR